jgi:hypothetical protein
LIQVVEHWAQIEMRPFMAQIQMSLHRQLRISQLSFGFFGLLGHSGILQKQGRRRVIY